MKKLLSFLLYFVIFKIAFAVPPGLTLNTNIRLNQVGFYPLCTKIGIVAGNPAAGNFNIRLNSDASIVYTAALGASATWTYSGETVRAADFSAFNTPGTYVLEVGGTCSYPFTIANNIFYNVNKASIKAYYYQRCGNATSAVCGGIYARAAGHITQDDSVMILPSSAGPTRTAGQKFKSQKGWYDAGDYNCYIVNSGISTYTLMATYEHFNSYFDTLNLNIPESGGSLPDLLDEIKWNLDWMLTMQDPADGGVYNKKTNANFDGFIMPSAATTQRYFCAKGTAAAFDFAAVMAVAYRIYKPFDAVYANQCLTAAKAAYSWGIANPAVPFNNPGASGIYPAVSTGGYGDNNFTDEREWAATELYIATLDNATYYGNSFKNTNTYNLPAWPSVNTLGLISLVKNRKNLNATGFADTTNMKNKLITLATPYRNQITTSAYKVAMGTAAGDFSWGSNSFAANEGMILLTAYEVNNDITFWNAALSNLDYLLGRNATTYCWLTNFGSNPTMNPHHRISQADGIVNPVPGWLAGGPQNTSAAEGGCSYAGIVNQPATRYNDQVCSYTTNEIAINWNAPFVFLSAAIQVLNPCSPISLPVTLLDFEAIEKNGQVNLNWITTNEINNDHFNIERSADGIHFTTIGTVNASTDKGSIKNYSYTDTNPLDGHSYYMLAQSDINGSIELSNTIAVYIKEPGINIYPNPSSGVFTLETDNIEKFSFVIHNLLGQKIIEEFIDSKEGNKIIDLGDAQKGVYFLTIKRNNDLITKKLILQ